MDFAPLQGIVEKHFVFAYLISSRNLIIASVLMYRLYLSTILSIPVMINIILVAIAYCIEASGAKLGGGSNGKQNEE